MGTIKIEVVDMVDVVVIELGNRLGLLAEAPQKVGIIGEVGVNEFDSHLSLQILIPSSAAWSASSRSMGMSFSRA